VRPERDLRRTADVLFSRGKVAVFIDGCFWHGCPEHFVVPATNNSFWAAKIERNRERDDETTARLELRGWLVLRFWEHESPVSVAERIARLVGERRADSAARAKPNRGLYHREIAATDPPT
jgi:DNA mismatch endonuclease (patch repair protein)